RRPEPGLSAYAHGRATRDIGHRGGGGTARKGGPKRIRPSRLSDSGGSGPGRGGGGIPCPAYDTGGRGGREDDPVRGLFPRGGAGSLPDGGRGDCSAAASRNRAGLRDGHAREQAVQGTGVLRGRQPRAEIEQHSSSTTGGGGAGAEAGRRHPGGS